MIPKGSMTIIIDELVKQKLSVINALEVERRARVLADEHCVMMDTLLENSLRVALGNKRIGKERQDIIVNEFCDRMLGVNDETKSK